MLSESGDLNQTSFPWVSNINSTITGNIYLIDLLADENVTIQLNFEPKNVHAILYKMPLYVIGNQDFSTIDINTEGHQSPITISKTEITFKNKVVHRDQGVLGVSHLKSNSKDSFQIVNHSPKAINFSFNLEALEDLDDVFKFDQAFGTIRPGAIQTISVTFQPDREGLFSVQVPVHFDYYENQAPFNLTIAGNGVEPSLAFDPPELYLPIKPLGDDSSISFTIINYGCERTEVKFITNFETISQYGRLELHFPEGKLLKSDGEKLLVIAQFKSNTGRKSHHDNSNHQPDEVNRFDLGIALPISFNIKIEFSDNISRKFLLPIHGTFNNSLFSLQPYLFQNRLDSNKTIYSSVNGNLNSREKSKTYEPIRR
jgi:hypothetical protein